LLAITAFAADWPRFRGPNGSGVADTSLPEQFGPGKNVCWKTPLPPGHSSPVLSGKHVFLTAFEAGRLQTICLRRDTGKILWRRNSPRSRTEPLDKRNHPASPTPVTGASAVYVFFPGYGLLSYGFDGVERWRVELGPFNNVYGMGASPIIAGGNIVLICDQSANSYIAAFDAGNGQLRWKTSRPEALSGHSTPVLYQPRDGPLQILAPGSFRLDAYSAATGEILWWTRGLASEMKSGPVLDGQTLYINGYNLPENDPGRMITIPPFEAVLAEMDADRDGRISNTEAPDERTRRGFSYIDLDRNGKLDAAEWKMYIAAMSAENATLAIRLGGRGETTGVIWKYHKAVPQLPSPLLYQGVLYLITDAGILTTFDPATGTVLKQGRARSAADRYFASPVAAGGKVFLLSHSGVVSVLRAGGGQELLAENDLAEESYATPAIADGRIYIRTRGALYCFGK
jgi:outer membrane protein assembly factor BamB